MTFQEYLNQRKWRLHEAGMDAFWEVLNKVATSAVPGGPTVGDGDMVTDYGMDPLVSYDTHSPGETVDPPALYRP